MTAREKPSATQHGGSPASGDGFDSGRMRARMNAWLLAVLVFALYVGFIAIGAFKSAAG